MMSSREQKNYLLQTIDEHLKTTTIESISATIDPHTDFTQIPHVTIVVPESGTVFRIVKSKEALTWFKNIINRRWPLAHSRFIRSSNSPYDPPTYRQIDIEFLNGIRYVRPYKPHALHPEHYRLRYGSPVLGHGWFGDGCYVVKGEPPKNIDRVKWRELPIDALNNLLDLTGAQKAEIVCEYFDHETFLFPLVALRSDQNFVFIQAVYLDIILRYHPKAEPYYKGHQEPILFAIDDATLVGAVMPISEPVPEWVKGGLDGNISM